MTSSLSPWGEGWGEGEVSPRVHWPMIAQQDIRFCTTTDGVQLAMGLYGSGPPLVKTATWLTHIERDPASALNGPWIRELAGNHHYITYDARGCGLSSREPAEVSVDAWVRDLEAVVDALGLKTFPLLGNSQGAAVAIAYAARHPERVSRLVLIGAFANSYFSTANTDPRIVKEANAMLQVMELGWGEGSPAFRQVFVSKMFPKGSPEQQRDFDEYQRLTASPGMAVRIMREMFKVDVREACKQVTCPALVFHSLRDQMVHFEMGRKVAALIPGARFMPLESDNHLPYSDEPCWPVMFAAIREFLGEAPATPAVRLTTRQADVLRHVAGGLTDKQIARELELSPRTIEMHVGAALKALGCTTRAEAVYEASRKGLLA
jgi:pimeloyl-ACP methyl ester carboxylesterase/DNA-binding CsgD family transcriptional regulator